MQRGQLDRAELLDHVRAAQRVVEELLVPVDARHARALEELLAHDLVPEVVDLLDLGEEAVAAEVEAVLAARAVADLGLGDAADLVLGLEHDHRAGPAWPAGSRRSGRRGRRPGSAWACPSGPGWRARRPGRSVLVCVAHRSSSVVAESSCRALRAPRSGGPGGRRPALPRHGVNRWSSSIAWPHWADRRRTSCVHGASQSSMLARDRVHEEHALPTGQPIKQRLEVLRGRRVLELVLASRQSITPLVADRAELGGLDHARLRRW